MKKKRVLHVITRMILGGAQQNTLYTVVEQQKDPLVDVTLLSGIDNGPEGNLHELARRQGVNLVLEPTLVRPIAPLIDIKALWRVYRFIKKGDYDVVHTHSAKAGIVGRVAAKLARVPIVVHTQHGLSFHKYQSVFKNILYIAIEKLCVPFTDAFISVCEKTRQGALAKGLGIDRNNFTIFSGMEMGAFLNASRTLSPEEAKRRLGIPVGAPVVGKVARLFPQKGHDEFFQAAKYIGDQNKNVWFLLVGNGILLDDLKAKAKTMGIAERTVFAGLVPPEEVPFCIQAMNVVVHTSLREGLARVLPQAGLVGKPVVTFALDGAPEVIRSGENGYLIPPLDTELLARRVLELLANPARCNSFGQQAQRFAKRNFGVELMAQRINEVYRWVHSGLRPAFSP